jgi:hypothetical protein
MVKKLFALASVTALAGLMVSVAGTGCSSTTTTAAGDTTDAAPAKKTDAKAPVGDQEEPPASTVCTGVIPVDATKLPWKSPFKTADACTEKDLTGLVSYLDANQNAKYADWKKAITSVSCSDCVFGKETDATWKPLAENTKGELTTLNVGGCIAIASKNDKCGQAYQNWFDCRFEACADCDANDTAAFQKCLPAANKGGCKAAFDNVGTVCTDQGVTDAEAACDGAKFVFEGPIRAQCIGLKVDGGDAG